MQALLVPARVARRSEEHRALVVVHAVDGVTEFPGEITANFRANQSGRTGDEEGFHNKTVPSWFSEYFAIISRACFRALFAAANILRFKPEARR